MITGLFVLCILSGLIFFPLYMKFFFGRLNDTGILMLILFLFTFSLSFGIVYEAGIF